MAYFLSPFGNTQVLDANGDPLVGGSWRTYLAGTTTPATTYTSQSGAVAQGTTMTLNELGLPENGPVWIESGIPLKFRLFDASGTLMDEWDNISGIGDTITSVDEWQPSGFVPTYISATSFSVVGDKTTELQNLRKIKTTNTGGITYSSINNAVFGAGLTTVTVTNISGVLDAGLSTVAYGFLSATNPSIPEGAFGATLRVTQTQAAARTALGIVDAPPVRQTVLSGPVDSNGFSAFVGATGSTTVTATGTLKATAAAGGDANYTGSITNPSWTGLSTNGSIYLFLDITSAGVVTTGSTTLAPTYQWGGTYSTTNLQNTFNIQEMTMKVGNGSAATQVYRVFVGEVTVAGGVVTAIVWYALMGRYRSADVACSAAGTPTSFSHNIGVLRCKLQHFLVCFSATGGWAIGDTITNVNTLGGANFLTLQPRQSNRNTATVTTAATTAYQGLDPTSGSITTIGSANFNQFMVVERGW